MANEVPVEKVRTMALRAEEAENILKPQDESTAALPVKKMCSARELQKLKIRAVYIIDNFGTQFVYLQIPS